MARIKNLVLIVTVLLTGGFYSYQSAYGWETVAQTYELFAVGTVEGTEKSYLYTIHPVTGEITMIGDTGLNNCKAIDFNSEGKLKAFCEARDEDAVTTKGLVAGGAVIVGLDTETGRNTWAVPHGATNNISDITIRDDDVLFSYENLDMDALHRHEETTDFQAMFIGSPGIEAEHHAMAAWGGLDLKVAANVGGAPTLFIVNADTGSTQSLGALSFPDAFSAAANASISTRIVVEEIRFGSMDALELVGGAVPVANSVSGALTGYSFAETDADFAATLFTAGVDTMAQPGTSKNGVPVVNWAAIALIDVESLNVDYIVELQNDTNPVIQAIALRQRPPAQVPTLSEWGLIATAVLLFAGALVFMRRRGLSMQS